VECLGGRPVGTAFRVTVPLAEAVPG
jgi:hypothetical protein